MIAIFIGLILRRIANTWRFMWQSFRVLKRYPHLMLLPVISAGFCVLVSIIVLGGGILAFTLPIPAAEFTPETPLFSVGAVRELTLAVVDRLLGDGDKGEIAAPRTDEERRTAEHSWLLLFLFYLANYSVIVYFNVAFASIVLDRIAGGHGSLDDGLRIAWVRKYVILQWSLLSATVGILLRMLRDQSYIGRWVASILGYIWSLATFFVMPLLALQSVSPGEALHRSAALLKEKWGEVIVAGFSFPLLFVVLAIPGMAGVVLAGFLGQPFGFAMILAISYWLLLAIVVFSAEQVFAAALYRHATEDQVTNGFSGSDLKSAWEGLSPLPPGQAP